MDLNQLARKYIRWQPPKVSASEPRRVIGQVMNLGTFEDVVALRRMMGEASPLPVRKPKMLAMVR